MGDSTVYSRSAAAAVIHSYLNITKKNSPAEKLNDPILSNRTHNNYMVMELDSNKRSSGAAGCNNAL